MTTINPELSKNPTIIAAFGIDDLSNLLPNNQFDTLTLEFFGNLTKTESLVSALSGPYFKHELQMIYHVKEHPPIENKMRGIVSLDKEGYDVIYSLPKESIFEKDENDNPKQ